MTWSREHDRIIAERCEGIHIRLGPGVEGAVRYDNYSTDIAACIRAAEGWQAQDPDRRGYALMSPTKNSRKHATLGNTFNHWDRFDDTMAAALAQALYEAVTNG